MPLDFPRWKVWMVLLTMVAAIAFAVPNFFPKSVTDVWPGFVPKARFNYGLDLQGGSHLLLEAETSDVAKQKLDAMEETLRVEYRRATPRIEVGDMSTAEGKLSFFVRDVAQLDSAVEKARALTAPAGLGGQRDWDVAVIDSTRIVMTPTRAGLDKSVNDALDTAREVVAKRIDPNGTSEVTVVRQGANRILVQVPGLQDPEGLKTLLGKTAKLEFKLVDLNANPADVAAGRAPPGSQVLPYPGNPAGGNTIAVQRRVLVSGDELIDATTGFEQRTNAPIVNIRFDGQGGRKFARVTQENTGKPFAIILDGVVISAPNINEPILGGSAQISGNFTVKSANDLAISLRSGKLPVALRVVEERTVGPDLGRDSIVKGANAGIVALLALVGFMIVTYFRFGIYTAIALVANALMIMGVMSIFNATLTLPGIAGFVLTIGAAVDANVLIFERIREEIRVRGRAALAATEFGFKEASRAIFDANITNVISAAIMFYFGSGPIRGFAVVLTIGIVTSVFTGVTLTRLMIADYLRRRRPKELVI
jgi:preprotein translocase subunit SecD